MAESIAIEMARPPASDAGAPLAPVSLAPAPPDGPATPAADDLALLAAVADPVRRTVLERLANGTHCVCDLQAHVPVAANLLSYHLKVLRDTGLVTTARRGRWVDYTLAGDAHDRLVAALPTRGAGEPAGRAAAAS